VDDLAQYTSKKPFQTDTTKWIGDRHEKVRQMEEREIMIHHGKDFQLQGLSKGMNSYEFSSLITLNGIPNNVFSFTPPFLISKGFHAGKHQASRFTVELFPRRVETVAVCPGFNLALKNNDILSSFFAEEHRSELVN
jgi:hypothetical protein